MKVGKKAVEMLVGELNPSIKSLFSGVTKPSNSTMFKRMPLGNDSGNNGLTKLKPHPEESKLLFSSRQYFNTGKKDTEIGAKESLVLAKAKEMTTGLTFDPKPLIEIRAQLKDGREILARRLGPDDLEKIHDFLRQSSRGVFDGLSSIEGHATRLAELMGSAACEKHDALVAIVDGKIVGLAEYDPDVIDCLETPISPSVLHQAGVEKKDVCVSRMVVDEKFRGLGIGSVLLKAQLESATNEGYKAVAGYTSNPVVKAMAKKLGAFVETEKAFYTWTLITTDPKKN